MNKIDSEILKVIRMWKLKDIFVSGKILSVLQPDFIVWKDDAEKSDGLIDCSPCLPRVCSVCYLRVFLRWTISESNS